MDRNNASKPKLVKQEPNDDQKKRSQEIKSAVQWLKDNFPKAFASENKDIKALKIGIANDIIAGFKDNKEAPLSTSKLRQAIKFYTGHHRYKLLLQKAGNPRIDLEGKVVGEVSKEHAEIAVKQAPVKPAASEKRHTPHRKPRADNQIKNTPVIKVKKRRSYSVEK